ncbi:hypothetical protein ACPOL_2602 [Acidisarcina polymorpha]|uniref:Uncharacterized protein n=1 Tax=Acidisarcina polymorpha TaxID=2211140 RepID=A0A2Z5FYJ1_9BACT|nr:hypothetical protein [Acidisarcina polymorpha]AXC11918.1 hypothetical protein ACPOL_2602 [Acidisarcina polymorpha]
MSIANRLRLCKWCLALAVMLTGYSNLAFPQKSSDGGGFNFPLVSCGWPYLTTSTDLNVFYPDSNAKYWTTPYLSLPGSKLVIKGKFLEARFLSINTYDRLGNSVEGIADKDFPVLTGSNPYTPGGATSPEDFFAITIIPKPTEDNPPPPPPGTIYGPPISPYFAAQGYVILRSYVDGETGGTQQAQLPDIDVSLNGKSVAVAPCEKLAPSLRLLTLTILERLAEQSAKGGAIVPPNATSTPEATFFPPYNATEGTFPNDFNKYVAAVVSYKPDRIVVVRGKSPTVPKTSPSGFPVTGQGEQMRYWSMCNNNHVFPYPVVECVKDNDVKIDAKGFYTFVVAAAKDMPANANTDPTVTPLPWGLKLVQNALILRNMLPTDGFNTTTQSANANCQNLPSLESAAKCAHGQMREYYPRAYYCDKHVFEAGGWKACVAASEGKTADD